MYYVVVLHIRLRSVDIGNAVITATLLYKCFFFLLAKKQIFGEIE